MKRCLLITCLYITTQFFSFGQVVSVYYYPWYDTNKHWNGGYLRDELTPVQSPLLGEYSNRDTAIIDQHLAWSETYGIDNWILSWWGQGSWEDNTIKYGIKPRISGRNVKYCLFYESAGLLDLQNDEIFFDSAKTQEFRDDITYIANTYFSDTNYFTINGRPVLFIYLTRTFSGVYPQAITQVRQDMQNLGYDIYLVGDEVYWGFANTTRIGTLDAITAYNMHGPTPYDGYPDNTGFFDDISTQYSYFRDNANYFGVSFIPGIMPGFNDRAVRLQDDHYVIPPKVHPDSGFYSTYTQFAELAIHYIDTGINMVCITSFNEWHEDTQIEPTIITDSTNTDQSGVYDYTQAYYYKGYGTKYLEITRKIFNDSIAAGITNPLPENSGVLLFPPKPNPANEQVSIGFVLAGRSKVEILIWDMSGRPVTNIPAKTLPGGTHNFLLDLSSLSKNMYMITIKSDEYGNYYQKLIKN